MTVLADLRTDPPVQQMAHVGRDRKSDLSRVATPELCNFLDKCLLGLGADWWTKHVVDRLSFQQQRMVKERG